VIVPVGGVAMMLPRLDTTACVSKGGRWVMAQCD
jgi:hypothetical protein